MRMEDNSLLPSPPKRRLLQTMTRLATSLRSKRNDSNILRGAEIVRQQIRRQFEEEDSKQLSSLLGGEGGDGSHDRTCSFSSEEEFSDPWTKPWLHPKQQSTRNDDSWDESTTVFPFLRQGSSMMSGAMSTTSSPGRSQGTSEVWGDMSVLDYSMSPPENKRPPPPPPPPPPVEDTPDTPVTYLGRDKSLKAKMVTYIVERMEEASTSDDSSYGFVGDDYYDDMDSLNSPPSIQKKSYLPSTLLHETQVSTSPVVVAKRTPSHSLTPHKKSPPPPQRPPQPRPGSVGVTDNGTLVTLQTRQDIIGPPMAPSTAVVPGARIRRSASEKTYTPVYATNVPLALDLPSPLSVEYDMLLHDPGYLHAQQAGMLWQSLVGQQVRFPSRWWNGARAPPMGCCSNQTWQYIGRCRVQMKRLRSVVRNRGSAGVLLLHIIVQDLMTLSPVQDVVLGCFHPNARGIRNGVVDPALDGLRDVWMAVRKRDDGGGGGGGGGVSVVDALLTRGRPWDMAATKSPLAAKTRISNQNVRAVYGESPPLETLFCPEDELYERLSLHLSDDPQCSVPMALLREFIFS